ncbi:hypothetical protein OVS_03265 [Mycoplasma ovis str. Michigan]|uniref:Uncharacterized protein n=1 Tax=Mycoplasma ovis str. Michigan TaxID=1415773 RepID=A0ABM5P1T9_9MOLU|nr:hypothetical protein [Mycoplasma ovis]AHC40406.1 hypothetical protein OVS_03265 [Mycoplasma ovis str. Michigan]
MKEIKVPTPSSPSPIKVKEMPLGDLPSTSINEEKLQTSVLEIEKEEEEEWHRIAQGYFLVSSNDFGMLEQMKFDSKNVKCMNKVIK